MTTVGGQAPGEGFPTGHLREARQDAIHLYVVPALRSRDGRIVGFRLA